MPLPPRPSQPPGAPLTASRSQAYLPPFLASEQRGPCLRLLPSRARTARTAPPSPATSSLSLYLRYSRSSRRRRKRGAEAPRTSRKCCVCVCENAQWGGGGWGTTAGGGTGGTQKAAPARRCRGPNADGLLLVSAQTTLLAVPLSAFLGIPVNNERFALAFGSGEPHGEW